MNVVSKNTDVRHRYIPLGAIESALVYLIALVTGLGNPRGRDVCPKTTVRESRMLESRRRVSGRSFPVSNYATSCEAKLQGRHKFWGQFAVLCRLKDYL